MDSLSLYPPVFLFGFRFGRAFATTQKSDPDPQTYLHNAPALALTQESNNFNVHKSDFTQVHEYADVLIVHFRLYVADICGNAGDLKEPAQRVKDY
jgi:hypothetical protein